MERRNWMKAAVLLLLLVTLSGGMPATAIGAAPSVTLRLATTTDENAPIPFSWTGMHLGRDHKLVIQKPMGTGHTWRSIMKLRTTRGSGHLPGIALGKYQFRIADLIGGRVVAQDRGHVAVFGEIPFSTLFGRSGYENVVSTPTFTFSFVGAAHVVYSTDTNIFSLVNKNHCRAAHIDFVTQNDHPATTLVKVIQESLEPVGASEPINAMGTIDAKLVPGQSWGVSASATYKEGAPDLFFNGYALCDSTEPFWG